MSTTRSQGQRDVALTSLPLRGIAINDASDNTDAIQVYASDSGILFINEYATETTYTLPAVVDCKGKVFFFYDNVGTDLIITGPTGSMDVMSGGNQDALVDRDQVKLTGVIGGWCVIIGDGTSYFCLAGTGTWVASG